jgi:NADH dehydrogenase FAD-containing subunit
VIDYKDYFEYTPGCLRLLVDLGHFESVSAPALHPHSTATLIQGELVAVQPAARTITVQQGATTSQLGYDYLLLGCGSEYPSPFKPSVEEPTLVSRRATWAREAAKLQAAQSVIVVGGGLVGTEVVGEILTAYPGMAVTVVDAADRCCANLPDACARYVAGWMRAHAVRVLPNSQIARGPGGRELAITETSVTLEGGRRLEADVVYRCMGMQPASRPLRHSLGDALNQRGALRVGDTLQVVGQERIFGMGDLMVHEATDEIKLGHTAEASPACCPLAVARRLP